MDSIINTFDTWITAQGVKSKVRLRSIDNISMEGINTLRELILRLAITGRLVPQDDADESASVILKKIEKEKKELPNNNSKLNFFSDISEDEKRYKLPRGWEYCRLGTLFNSIISGGTPSKSNPAYWNGEIPWASVKDLGGSKYIDKTQDYITEAGLQNGSKLAQVGDLIICTRMGLGKIAIARAPIAINQDLKAVTLTSQINVEYFLIFYSALEIVGKGTTVDGITQAQLLNYVFFLPPLAEQHRIVAKVNELIAACDKLERAETNHLKTHETLVRVVLDRLTAAQDAEEFEQAWQRVEQNFDMLFTTEDSIEQLKQTILKLAVMGKLVKQDPNDEPASELIKRITKIREKLIAEEGLKTTAEQVVQESERYMPIPQSWEYYRIGNLVKFIDYRGKTPQKVSSGIRLITAKNVRQGYISLEPEEFIKETDYESWMTRGFPRIGDLLFTTEAPLGNVAQINIEGKIALAQRTICFQPHVKDISTFLVIFIRSSMFQKVLMNLATGMTATGVKASKLKEVPVPLPPLPEQYRIVDKVNELFAFCDRLKERIFKSDIIKNQLADSILEQIN